MDFKDHWDLDTALKVVQNKTVDSSLWAEAVEWLLLYGPPEIVSILMKASKHATTQCFPNLETIEMTDDGIPCYDITQLARSLSMSEMEVRQTLAEKELAYSKGYYYAENSSKTIH